MLRRFRILHAGVPKKIQKSFRVQCKENCSITSPENSLTILSSDQQDAAKPEKETYEAKVKQRMTAWTADEKVVSCEGKTIYIIVSQAAKASRYLMHKAHDASGPCLLFDFL